MDYGFIKNIISEYDTKHNIKYNENGRKWRNWFDWQCVYLISELRWACFDNWHWLTRDQILETIEKIKDDDDDEQYNIRGWAGRSFSYMDRYMRRTFFIPCSKCGKTVFTDLTPYSARKHREDWFKFKSTWKPIYSDFQHIECNECITEHYHWETGLGHEPIEYDYRCKKCLKLVSVNDINKYPSAKKLMQKEQICLECLPEGSIAVEKNKEIDKNDKIIDISEAQYRDMLAQYLIENQWNVRKEHKVENGIIDILAEKGTYKIIVEVKLRSDLNSIQRAIGQLMLYKSNMPEAEMYFAVPQKVNIKRKGIMNDLGIKIFEEVFGFDKVA